MEQCLDINRASRKRRIAAALDYIVPLQEEMETAMSVEEWTKPAPGKLRKLDRFLRVAEAYRTWFWYVRILVNVLAAARRLMGFIS